MIISNRAQDEFNHAMWKILEKNEKLKELSNKSYNDNPEHLCPSPRICKIIEQYAAKENQDFYKEIAAKWENGSMTLDEEYKYEYIIKFLRDWFSVLLFDYQCQYCYGYLSTMIDCLSHSAVLEPNEKEKVKSTLFKTYGFSQEDGREIETNWQDIVHKQEKADKELEENNKRLEQKINELKQFKKPTEEIAP